MMTFNIVAMDTWRWAICLKRYDIVIGITDELIHGVKEFSIDIHRNGNGNGHLIKLCKFLPIYLEDKR